MALPTQPLRIDDNSLAGWAPYRHAFGFVPDPMILRTGEVFLNGAKGAAGLNQGDRVVWETIEQNIDSLLDFFDIVVTRDVIPLINYYDTFDRVTTASPLDTLLADRIRHVEIGRLAYNAAKQGALENLARMDFRTLTGVAGMLQRLRVFGYDWKISLSVEGQGVPVPGLDDAARPDDPALILARFLLGGFIFNGFAQASGTTHYLQPKRARFLFGLTTIPESVGALSRTEEDAIFTAVEAKLKAAHATVRHARPLPPVLPYLLRSGAIPKTPGALLEKALAFREKAEGIGYRKLAAAIRADGAEARRAEDLARREWREAVEMLAPYSNLDQGRSATVDIKLKGELFGIGGEAAAKLPVAVPPALRLWWNDHVPFGGVSKTLRRMWMEAEAYRAMSDGLRDIWVGGA